MKAICAVCISLSNVMRDSNTSTTFSCSIVTISNSRVFSSHHKGICATHLPLGSVLWVAFDQSTLLPSFTASVATI